MYSQILQRYVAELAARADVTPGVVTLLNESVACFLGAFGSMLGVDVSPRQDYLTTSVRLLLLSDGLERMDHEATLDGAHYLVGLGLEQTGALLARSFFSTGDGDWPAPLESDHWYRIVLALLHYLAGGHRVQALGVMRQIEVVSLRLRDSSMTNEYQSATSALWRLYRGRLLRSGEHDVREPWDELLSGRRTPSSRQETRLARLASKIIARREEALALLGRGNEEAWGGQRGMRAEDVEFWRQYLKGLEARGITTFTPEQIGPGFDVWLRNDKDVLAVLPTGSGKSIVGELRSAISLGLREQVLWLVPTRALVRQTKHMLRKAFENTVVAVEELPTTEDFIPLFADQFAGSRRVAVTTPERVEALLRAVPDAADGLGLVVVDEAQILAETRGTTVEFVLQSIAKRAPSCHFVLMTAFGEHSSVLQAFLNGLGNGFVQLAADTRPTRRLYGVLTSSETSGSLHPTVLLYPPGLQSVSDVTVDPFRLTLLGTPISSRNSPTELGERFLRSVATASIRSVMFVGRRDSTEVQAERIAEHLLTLKQTESQKLPANDTARLRVELGRDSAIEATAAVTVAPHHAGLTPLEQHIVEKWLRSDLLRTVVATPTLAQGINLPFDVSLVTFTSRYDEETGRRPDLTQSEIMNMIGRAGRAGYASDGIGLLVISAGGRTPNQNLDDSRRFFFGREDLERKWLGLARLAFVAAEAGVANPSWIHELGGATFGEATALVSFVIGTIADSADPAHAIRNRLHEFPSIQALAPQLVDSSVDALSRLGQTLREELGTNEELLQALTRTGMPLDLLQYFLGRIHDGTYDPEMPPADVLAWADSVVFTGLQMHSERAWYASVIGRLDLERMFQAIRLWRSGVVVAGIESEWRLRPNERANRIQVGVFLNHSLSLISQFWGSLAVCEEVALHLPNSARSERLLVQLPVFVREGVQSFDELNWLHSIGGLDRVLAHQLARVLKLPVDVGQRRHFVREQIVRWRQDHALIPSDLEEPYRSALVGAITDQS